MAEEANEWEIEAPDVCDACGQELGLEPNRAYAVDEERVICFECALARGGVYDAEIDRWVEPPDVTGLFEADAEWANPHRRSKSPYERGRA